MDLELRHVKFVFLKATSKGLEKIDSGMVLVGLLWQVLLKDSVISRV